MLNIAIMIVAVIICIALILNLWRLFIGPHIVDRILALDTMFINSIALILLLGMYNRKAHNF